MDMIKIVTSAGPLEVPALHIWTQQVMGTPFRFALHATGSGAKGFERRLAISELGTGFDIKAKILHPKSRMELTVNSAQAVKRSELKKIAHAATHGLIKKIGEGTFVKAILDARLSMALRSAKVEEFVTAGIDTEASGPGINLSEPVNGTITGRASSEQVEFLDKLMATCEACNGSQVVVTTEKDHEGNAIETTCPVCISKAIEMAETPIELPDPEDELEQLKSRRDALLEAGDQTGVKADVSRLDARIKALTLDGLRLRLEALNDVAAQHGTMTGDTTEQDFEDLAYNICDLEMQIAELEKTNAPE